MARHRIRLPESKPWLDYEPVPKDKTATPCPVCRSVSKGAAALAAHELRAHSIHRYRGKRVQQVLTGVWQVEGRRNTFPSLKAARAAAGVAAEGRVRAASGGLPSLGKR